VIPTFKNLTKRAFADAFIYFKSVSDVIVDITNVFAFVVVEAAVLWTIRRCKFISFSFKEVDEVDLIVLEDLCFFIVKQVLGKMHQSSSWFHGELDLELFFAVLHRLTASDCSVVRNFSWRVRRDPLAWIVLTVAGRRVRARLGCVNL